MSISRADFFLSKKQAQTVFDKFGLGVVNSISQKSLGLNNYSFIINKKYVIRMTRRNISKYLDREYIISKRLLNKFPRFPVPKIIVRDNSCKLLPNHYQIQSFVCGAPLNKLYSKLSSKEKISIAKDLGRNLAKIHSIHFRYSGRFASGREISIGGVQPTIWFNLHKKYFLHNLAIFKTHNAVSKKTLHRYRSFFNVNKYLLQRSFRPSLIHHDLNWNNFHILNGKVSGIFDFEWGFSGDVVYELAMLEYNWFDEFPDLRKPFFKEYIKIHKIPEEYDDLVPFYGFLNKLMALAGVYEDNEPQDPNEYVLAIDKLLKSVNY